VRQQGKAQIFCYGLFRLGDFTAQKRTADFSRSTGQNIDSSENAAVTCETFVPDFSGNVYGRQPVLEFHKYFCPVRKFNSMDELAALIHHAADESKAYFAALNGAK